MSVYTTTVEFPFRPDGLVFAPGSQATTTVVMTGPPGPPGPPGNPSANWPFTINSRNGAGKITSITYHTDDGDVTTTYTYGPFGVATETTGSTTITFDYVDGKLSGAH